MRTCCIYQNVYVSKSITEYDKTVIFYVYRQDEFISKSEIIYKAISILNENIVKKPTRKGEGSLYLEPGLRPLNITFHFISKFMKAEGVSRCPSTACVSH